jgi:potassium inwardly-rectifying channel subfamily J
MAGIVFAKFTKPTMRAETILFSKNALVTMRNGSFYLICRIADLRLVRSLYVV